MMKKDSNYIISIVILLVFALGISYLSLRRPLPVSDAKILGFPLEIGSWIGEIIPPEKNVVEILGTDKILLGEYSNPEGEKVWFTVVYGEGDRQSFHPPEYCYIGGGNTELVDKKLDKVNIDDKTTIEVNSRLFQTGPHKQLVFYWYMAGDRVMASYNKQQVYFVLDEIRHRSAKGALIKVSTLVINGDTKGAFNRLKDFMGEAVPILSDYL